MAGDKVLRLLAIVNMLEGCIVALLQVLKLIQLIVIQAYFFVSLLQMNHIQIVSFSWLYSLPFTTGSIGFASVSGVVD
jgi:hypothetical protein